MRRRILAVGLAVVASSVAYMPSASATIHPLVESFDCANEQAFAHHPLGDVADPPGQTPGETHSDTSTLRAIEQAGGTPAAFGHKLDGQCGHAGP
jgi:hypothetical protein